MPSEKVREIEVDLNAALWEENDALVARVCELGAECDAFARDVADWRDRYRETVRERDAALARVRELEAKLATMRDSWRDAMDEHSRLSCVAVEDAIRAERERCLDVVTETCATLGLPSRAIYTLRMAIKADSPACPTCGEPLDEVLALKERHAQTWKNEPWDVWLAGLIEEVGELAASLAGRHEHPPELELRQIAAIALNWLDHPPSCPSCGEPLADGTDYATTDGGTVHCSHEHR